jgi:hypothetical protein
VAEEMYIDISSRLKDAVRRNVPGNVELTNSWFLLNDNAPTHWSVFVIDFVAKNNKNWNKPKNSLDLAPAHVYVFPPLKLAVKGQGLHV